MPRWTLHLIAAMLASTLALPAAAQWKWRDKNGQTQYSDLPPPQGVTEQEILSRPPGAQRRAPVAAVPASGPASAASAALLAVRPVDPELEARRKKAEQEEAAKKKAEEERQLTAKMDNCSRAKGQLRTLESGQRIARTNEKGEREFIDDATRAAEIKRTRDIIGADCKP